MVLAQGLLRESDGVPTGLVTGHPTDGLGTIGKHCDHVGRAIDASSRMPAGFGRESLIAGSAPAVCRKDNTQHGNAPKRPRRIFLS